MNYFNKRGITGLKGTNLKRTSQITKVLNYIDENAGATKYECITNALGKTGSKEKLRGYYSCIFSDLVYLGLCSYTKKGYKYSLTDYGIDILENAKNRI